MFGFTTREREVVEQSLEVACGCAALDRGVMSAIVPQLEGLPNSKLKAFTDWWSADVDLNKLTESLAAARDLMSGLDLFISEPG